MPRPAPLLNQAADEQVGMAFRPDREVATVVHDILVMPTGIALFTSAV